MAVKINALEDFIDFFPHGSVRRLQSEYDSPCPFCEGEGEIPIVHNGKNFYGTDRLSWFIETNTFYCRTCQRNPNKRRYIFNIVDLIEKLELTVEVSNSFFEGSHERQESPIPFWSEFDVLTAHYRHYDKSYWKEFGWSEDVINRFKLGYGTVSYNVGDSWIIPMNLRTVKTPPNENQFYITYRTKNEKGSRRLSGTVSEYFWHIRESQDTTVVLTEGEKDAISAYAAGYRNIVASLGTNGWNISKTRYLAAQGYTKLIIFGDNDEAGTDFAESVFKWSESIGIDTYVLKYPEDAFHGYDLTNLFQHYAGQTIEYINNNIIKPNVIPTLTETTRPTYIRDYVDIEATYMPDNPPVLTREDVRGTGVYSMQARSQEFLTTYPSRIGRGRGLGLVFKASPGSGKTTQLVQIAQEEAEKAAIKRANTINEMAENIENLEAEKAETNDPETIVAYQYQIDKIRSKMESLPHAAILWVSPFKTSWDDVIEAGANRSLWHNFVARNVDNCENYEYTLELAANNHNVGTFCQVACPFKELCLKRGYLAQEEQRKNKPITMMRHQSLLVDTLLSDYRQLVIIDETPFHTVETPLVFTTQHTYPHREGWDLEVADTDSVKMLNMLAEALRHTMSLNVGQHLTNEDGTPNLQYDIYGKKFLAHLDEYVKKMYNVALETVVMRIPRSLVFEYYQPNYIGTDKTSIKLRAMPFIYDVIASELANYLNPEILDFPSCIHLVAGLLEIYLMKPVKISARTPVIIADATADMPELYGAMLRRPIEEYAPLIRNEQTKTTVYRGSDWTISQLQSQLGKELHDRSQQQKIKSVEDVFGNEFDLTEIPANPKLYDNPLFRDYVDAISFCLEQNENLLVVTHKKIRHVLEDVFKNSYPQSYQKLAFGHYGSLRGTNWYKDYKAVVLIGVPRMPYDIMWRRINAWANLLNMKDPIPFEMGYHSAPYHTRNDGHTYYTFNHSFARKYANMYETSEMIQCMERIRPHTSDEPKEVHIFASRPAALWVTNVRTKTDFMNQFRVQSKVNRIKQYIINTFTESGQVPSRNQIMALFTCGVGTYSEARKLAQDELGLTLPRGKNTT